MEYYRQGALSVRTANSAFTGSRESFAVWFDHGSEASPKPATVPAWCHRSDGQGIAQHPAFIGQSARIDNRDFRTKTAAKRYMLALSAAGILPEDRPATREEVHAVRDWIEMEGERC